MLIYIRVIFVMLLVAMPYEGARAQSTFFDTLYDVPVISGLTALPEMSYVYDTPQGRVAHSAAMIEGGTAEAIYAGYTQILPQFGWSVMGQGLYGREGEFLEISHEVVDNAYVFHFELRPMANMTQK